MNGSNYIQYLLSAYLPLYDQSSSNQMYTRPLHIREPLRTVPRPLGGEALSESLFCGCCCSCGHTKLTFQADVHFLTYDQIFHIRGAVDNALSKTALNSIKVVLQSKITKVASTGRTNVHMDKVTLYDSLKKVPVGGVD